MQITQEQQEQLEKNAGALKLLFGAGKLAMKPFTAALGAGSKVARPLLKLTGKTIGGAGKLVGSGVDHVVMPVASTAAKTTAKALGGAGAVGAGATAELGKGIGKSVVAPMVKGYGNMLKEHPVGTVLNTGFLGMGVNDVVKRTAAQPFVSGSKNLERYNNLKMMYEKRGCDMSMEKEAGALDIGKKVLNYGGTLPSLVGLGVLAALPVVAGPSLSGLGDSIKRTIFPLDARINAEEEIAKKQLGIATSHQMDTMLGQYVSANKSHRDVPVMENNLNYYIENDPIINDYAHQSPSSVDQLRETLHTVYKFAPDIATNRQAAHSILRESAMSPDGGLNYNTVKLIADAQKSISQGKKSYK